MKKSNTAEKLEYAADVLRATGNGLQRSRRFNVAVDIFSILAVLGGILGSSGEDHSLKIYLYMAALVYLAYQAGKDSASFKLTGHTRSFMAETAPQKPGRN